MVRIIYDKIKELGFKQEKQTVHHKRLGISKSFNLDQYHIEIYKGGTRYNNWRQIVIYGGSFTKSEGMPNKIFDIFDMKDLDKFCEEFKEEFFNVG